MSAENVAKAVGKVVAEGAVEGATEIGIQALIAKYHRS